MHFGKHVDDEVPPYLTLEVDGLTSTRSGREEAVELQPDDGAGVDESTSDLPGPETAPVADDLDVYGWESSVWRKIRSFLGF